MLGSPGIIPLPRRAGYFVEVASEFPIRSYAQTVLCERREAAKSQPIYGSLTHSVCALT
jgi:hypothetical protein